MEDLEKRYFDWMVRKITFKGKVITIDPKDYTKLLTYLYNRSFEYYILPMDGNRSEDGIDLRYTFGYEEGIDQHEIERYLDHRDCSMLEMMVALAIKAENIVGDSALGDRTGLWFWGMIHSLGLLWVAEDCNYDEMDAIMAVDHFLDHDYASDGRGGLFTVKDPPRDMRDTEIWNQMCWYLNEYA